MDCKLFSWMGGSVNSFADTKQGLAGVGNELDNRQQK